MKLLMLLKNNGAYVLKKTIIILLSINFLTLNLMIANHPFFILLDAVNINHSNILKIQAIKSHHFPDENGETNGAR